MLRFLIFFLASCCSIIAMDRDFSVKPLAVIASDGVKVEDPLLERFGMIRSQIKDCHGEDVIQLKSPTVNLESSTIRKLLSVMNGDNSALELNQINDLVLAADYLDLDKHDFSLLGNICKENCKEYIYEFDSEIKNKLDPLVKDLLFSDSFFNLIKRGAIIPSRDFLPQFSILDLSSKRIKALESVNALTSYIDPRGVTSIYLDHNKLTKLDKKLMDDLLGNFFNLTALDLSHNQIDEVQSKALQGLPTGFRLLLNDNKIEKIAPDALGAQELGFIDFKNNPKIGPKEVEQLELQIKPSKLRMVWRQARNFVINKWMLGRFPKISPAAIVNDRIALVADDMSYGPISKALTYCNAPGALEYIRNNEKLEKATFLATNALPTLLNIGAWLLCLNQNNAWVNRASTLLSVMPLIETNLIALQAGLKSPIQSLSTMPEILSRGYAKFLADQISSRFFSKIEIDLVASHPHYFEPNQNVKIIVDPVQCFGDSNCIRCETNINEISRSGVRGTSCCRKFICRNCANNLWHGADIVCPACQNNECRLLHLNDY